MSKMVIRLITLIIAVAMVACLAVGCGGNSDNPGSKPDSSKPSGDNGGNGTGMLASVNPEDYRGTKVVYASWKDPYQNEDGVAVDAFKAKYGMEFEWQQVDQGKYVSLIATSISNGTQADVFFENGDFPGSLTVMQPLDAAMLDLEDPIWNKALIKASTLEGHPYLVDAISNVWTEVDICVYNKNIFESNGFTTPTEYYEAGKWTFANFRNAAKQVADLGKEYSGAGILGESALGAAGSSFFTYKDNAMHVSVDDHLREVMVFLAEMKDDKIAKLDRGGFNEGKQGMALTNCFGLKRTGYYTTINPEHVAATYLPVWKEGDPQKVTGIYRGWGLIEGAKNPVGAGLFLRQYLDVNNYDLDATFHNTDVANFFFQVTGQYSEDMIYYHGPDLVKTTGMGELYHEAGWNNNSAANVNGYIDKHLNTMNEMVRKANEIIAEESAEIIQGEKDGILNKLSGKVS